MDRPEKGEEMSEERIKMDRNEEYPNDKETQEWMNGSMGTPMKRESKQHRMEACPECDAEHQETVKFWMDKWEKRSDEFYALESENKDLNQKLSEIQAELKEAWSFSSKNGTQAREAERQIEVLREALKHLRNAVTFANPSEINGVEVYEALVPIGFVKIANDALLSPAPSEKCEHDKGEFWEGLDYSFSKKNYLKCLFCSDWKFEHDEENPSCPKNQVTSDMEIETPKCKCKPENPEVKK